MNNEKIMLKISEVVCNYFRVDIKYIQSTSRKKEYVKCRHIICSMIYQFTDCTHENIKAFIKYNERSNISYVIRTVNERRKRSKPYEYDCKNIEKMISQEMRVDKAEHELLVLKTEHGDLYNRLHKIVFDAESKFYLNNDLSELENESKQILKKLEKFTCKFNK